MFITFLIQHICNFMTIECRQLLENLYGRDRGRIRPMNGEGSAVLFFDDFFTGCHFDTG